MSALLRGWIKRACVVSIVAISGCAVRDVPESANNCDYACDSACPPGFACRDGYCVKPDFDGVCPSPPVEPDPIEGPCPAGAETLTLSPLAPILACTGEEVDVLLEVTGGDGPFTWFSEPEVPGLVLEETSASRARLSGTLQDVESFELRVGAENTDSCANFQVQVDVAGTPIITTTFPDACVGQPIDLELTAVGGDPATYAWGVEGVPELTLSGARLMGNAPLEAGQREVTLSLRDARCPAADSEPVQRLVSWNVKAPGECPQVATAALPAPCAGIEYSEALVPSDGSGSGYTWSVLSESLPDGLAFDAERGVVHGTPTGASSQGSIEVLLTDSAGQRAVKSLDLSLRDNCWLAYVGEEPARLHLRDVFAAVDALVLPQSLPVGEVVVDMKFSPNGAWLAFRAGATNAERLYLYPLEGARPPDATAVTFTCPSGPCAVLDYAWSESSAEVAVVLSGPSAEQDHLSGVNVAAPAEPWPVASSVSSNAVDIDLDYLRDLVWIPQGRFAFVARTPNDPPDDVFSFPAGLTAGPLSEGANDTDLRLRATRGGWVTSSASSYLVAGRNVSNDFAVHGTAWISPSGGYVAITDDATLSISALGNSPSLAVTEAGDCVSIVAWALMPNGTERIACSAGDSYREPNGENLKVFDYRPGQSQFEPARGRSVPTNASYVPSVLSNIRRMFSPDGEWLLIGGPSAAVLAPVPSGTTSLPPPIDRVTFSGTAELQFAADGRSLLVYDQFGLRRSPIPDRGVGGGSLSTDAEGHVVPPPSFSVCEEEPWVSPDNWCGALHTPSHFAVSVDSKSVLLEGGDDSLWLTDLSAVPQRPAERIALRRAPCPGACAGVTYAFQP